MFNTFAVHRSNENFPNPNEFNIDKWLSLEKEEYKSKLYAFSTGPRACIGKELAWMEMLLILSHLFHRFNIEMDPKTNITPANGFLLTPKEKCIYATFKKRVF
jgi:cytochrome P450